MCVSVVDFPSQSSYLELASLSSIDPSILVIQFNQDLSSIFFFLSAFNRTSIMMLMMDVTRLGPKPNLDLPLLFEVVQQVGVEREPSTNRRKALWIEVAQRYNIHVGGETGEELYDANSCRRAWNNLKVRTRKKYSDLMKEHAQKEGGDAPKPKMDPFSMEVLAEISHKPEGQSKVTDSCSDNTGEGTHFERNLKRSSETILWLNEDSLTRGPSSSEDESQQGETPSKKQIREPDYMVKSASQPSSSVQEDFYSSQDSNDSFTTSKRDPIQVFNSNRATSPIGTTSSRRNSTISRTKAHPISRVRRSNHGSMPSHSSVLTLGRDDNQIKMETKLRIEEYQMKRAIFQIEKETAEIQRKAAKAKAIWDEQVFEIEKKKLTDMCELEVSAAKYRVRRERALALKAEREAGIQSPTTVDELLLE